jgi:hypothetical protein
VVHSAWAEAYYFQQKRVGKRPESDFAWSTWKDREAARETSAFVSSNTSSGDS